MSHAAQGRVSEALPLLERALAVLRVWGQPIDIAEALLCQGSVLREVGEPERAATALSEARTVLDACPDPGVLLLGQLATLERPTRPTAYTDSGDLTQRELDVLRLLRGSLSESDIASELYVSHNTVHTHIRSIYRKLGVSSRAEAVERGRKDGIV